MALNRLQPGSHFLAALAGAVGGGLPWIYNAALLVQDPLVHDVAVEMATAGGRAATKAAMWLDEAAASEHKQYCMEGWQAFVLLVLMALAVFAVNLAIACCCGPLGFYGGREWQRRQRDEIHKQPAQFQTHAAQLAQLADFISTGGQPAINAAAAELAALTGSYCSLPLPELNKLKLLLHAFASLLQRSPPQLPCTLRGLWSLNQ